MSGISPTLPTSRAFVTQLLDSLSTALPQATLIDNSADANPLNNVPDATKKQLLALQVLFPNEFVPALDLLDRRLVTRFRICDNEELALLKTTAEERREEEVEGVRRGHDEQMQDTDSVCVLQDQDTQIERRTTTHTQTDIDNRHDGFPGQNNVNPTTNTIYYVRSAQQRSSRYSTSYDTLTWYQVRLSGWNCSCPAFALAAFPPPLPPSPPPTSPPHPLPSQFNLDPSVPPPTETSHTGRRDSNTKKWIFGGITLGSESMPPVCKHLLACVLAERCKGLFGGFVREESVGVEEAAGWAAGWGD